MTSEHPAAEQSGAARPASPEFPGSHGYSHDKARYAARMRRIEGQVRGISRMIEDDKYCIDILTQISAATSALENVGLALLDEHLAHCVAGAAGASPDAVDARVEEAMQAIKRMVKS
ncbi:metal-sensitive transcriptional regulator [Corynebacterium liangguodongii]|uniref:Transcriptional regulator n=1 Tax=Corynebacterium liangguodongii TaxID=2079535 RepID=A0A2S0WFP1_9CORY|nr:metal-sensitive transcriptional regulator [Corynebacterium liangguodongii]AWB84603.1 transcriptional regulator [Corynebacterium liangguodongii]PWB99611.1 metal-sensitive transcriptional regulator [Corynebacterium liangguodongii]